MKIVIFKIFLLLLLFEFFTPVYSQKRVKEGNKVFYKYTKKPLTLIIEDLRQKTGNNYIYINDVLDKIVISCKIDSAHSENSLEKVLHNYNISISKFPGNSFVLSIDESVKSKGNPKNKIKAPSDNDQIVNWSNPILINQHNVKYPILAMNGKIEGEVKLLVLINTKGVPQKVKIVESSGSAILDSATVDIIKSKEFLPAYANDKPVNVWTSLTFKYNIKSN